MIGNIDCNLPGIILIYLFIYLFIISYYPRGHKLSVRASPYMSTFCLCCRFCSSLAGFRPFFYPFFLHCLMVLVYLLPWYIPAYTLSPLCLPKVLTPAFSLFQSPFWVSSFVLWIFGILRGSAPLSLFHIRIGSMVCSWCRSDGDSDSIHSGVFVVVRFLSPSFDL